MEKSIEGFQSSFPALDGGLQVIEASALVSASILVPVDDSICPETITKHEQPDFRKKDRERARDILLAIRLQLART